MIQTLLIVFGIIAIILLTMILASLGSIQKSLATILMFYIKQGLTSSSKGINEAKMNK